MRNSNEKTIKTIPAKAHMNMERATSASIEGHNTDESKLHMVCDKGSQHIATGKHGWKKKNKIISEITKAHMTMETARTVSIESHNTDESKLVLDHMVCDKRSQKIDTDKDWWNKKVTKADNQLTRNKRKSPIESTIIKEREEKKEGPQFSSSEQLLFKNLSEAISEYHHGFPDQHRHQGCARSNSHDGALLEMAPSQPDRNPGNEEPIIPNKRPRYQRRDSFVIRHDKKSTFPPRGLLEGYDDDHDDVEDRPLLNRSASYLFSPQPEMPSHKETGGNLSWSNTNDTAWYKFACMSVEDAEPLIPEPPCKRGLSSQHNASSGSTSDFPDTCHRSAFHSSSLAISGLQTENNAMDTLDGAEKSMRASLIAKEKR
jgi:hypothetical protein